MYPLIALSCNAKALLSLVTGVVVGFATSIFGMGLAWAAGRPTPPGPNKNKQKNSYED